MQTIHQLKLPLLLPNVENLRDQCIARLAERLRASRGVEDAHIDTDGGEPVLCMHYDTELIPLERLERLARQAGAAITNRFKHESVPVSGMTCTDCATSIEDAVSRMNGVVEISVSYAAERMRVEYDSTLVNDGEIERRVRQLGYALERDRKNGFLAAHTDFALSLICGVFLAAGFIGGSFFGLPQPVSTGLYIAAYLAGGWGAFRKGVAAAIQLRLDIDFLMVVAAAGAAIIGRFSDGALLLFLFSLGHSLEHFAMGRARGAISALSKLVPRTARVRRSSGEYEIAAGELLRGDFVVIRPGERVPIDGVVAEGASSVDESAVTGESLPKEKNPGDALFAGTLNGSGPLVVEVTKLAKDTTLSRVIEMVEAAQTQKSRTQVFSERFERGFVPAVLVLVVLAAAVPTLAGWLPFRISFFRAMALLVAASPCALAIATPAAVLAAIAQGARNGVLIKGGIHLETLGSLRAIAFDKTGTLTTGLPVVTDIIPLNGETRERVLALAAAIERNSTHPLARAILAVPLGDGYYGYTASEARAVPGRGITSEVDGERLKLGTARFFSADSVLEQSHRDEIATLERQGKSVVILGTDRRLLGIIAVSDTPRPEAAGVVRSLRNLGIERMVVLTGDNRSAANAVSAQVGLDEVQAELLPQQKVDAMKELVRACGTAAMVGDGVNDAPAMVSASVGIAMGAGGTDVALETSDVALIPSLEVRRIVSHNGRYGI